MQRPEAFALAFVVGCSAGTTPASDDASADAPADAPLVDAPAIDAPIGDGGAVDAPSFNYNDCTNFDFDQNDFTAPDASRVVLFSFRPATQQYAPRCLKIRAGETVRWTGSFADHPLVSAGGDVPNPVDGVAADAGGTTTDVTFPNAGWYGFECKVHESPAEYGAVLVVP